MQTPATITFEGLRPSESVERAVLRHVDELERFYERITSCRVVVARPHRRARQGALFSVRIDLTLPGAELVVNRERRFDHAHEDVHVAVRDAFRAARRRLEDRVRRRRGSVKSRAPAGEGRAAGGPRRGRKRPTRRHRGAAG